MFISAMKTVAIDSDIFAEELFIENGGDLKMIRVSEEFIAGYSASSKAEKEHELFVCRTKKQLERYVSKVVAIIAWGFFTNGGNKDVK